MTPARHLPLLLGAAILSVPVSAAPANATPCDQSVRHWVGEHTIHKSLTLPPRESDYNPKDDGLPDEVTVTFGKTKSFAVKKHWEAGAEGEVGWGPAKLKISGKYGREYTRGTTTQKSKSKKMILKDGWTGWMEAIVYRHHFKYRGYTYRWNARKGACVKRTVAKGIWTAPQIQYVTRKKKGHYYP